MFVRPPRQRRDELAVEGGDVGHDAAPARVGGARDTSEYAYDNPLRRPREVPRQLLVCSRV